MNRCLWRRNRKHAISGSVGGVRELRLIGLSGFLRCQTKFRNVRSRWELDLKGRGRRGLVIAKQASANVACRDPNDGVVVRVVTCLSPEDGDAEDALLDSVEVAGQGVFHYVRHELLATTAVTERLTGEN
jgi:hypothetical protein